MAEVRLPPNDPLAEEAVLGCLLLDGDSIYKLSGWLKMEDFFREQNGWVYSACEELFRRQEPVNQVTVASELERVDRLEKCGGVAYLVHLVETAPTPFEVDHYAHLVYRLSKMRQLIAAAGQIAAIGYAAEPDVGQALDKSEDILYRIRGAGELRDFLPLRQLLDQYFERAPATQEHPQRLPHIFTGFAAVDEWLGGLHRSNLVILGARPSLGKTSLALNIARNAAVMYNACVAFFSLEMSRDEVVERLLAAEATVEARRLRLGLYTEEEERRLMDASGTLADAPIYVDDSPQPRIMEIRSKARRLHQERGVDLIVVDYIQLIQGDGRSDNRVQELSLITRSLKGLARELEVPVLAISQLSRAPEMRSSHRPQLSDLRESGSIEQDADVVLFIHRDDYYYKTVEDWVQQAGRSEEEYHPGVADIMVAKHRNGPIGEVKLRWVSRTARFENLEAARTQDETLPGLSP